MQGPQYDMKPEDAAAALAWLAEMGVDEIIGEVPVNRLAPVAPVPPVPSSRRKPGPTHETVPPPALPSSSELGSGLRRNDGLSGPDACQTLDDIVAALSNFDACPLKKTATKLCFADGNPAARVLLVGEAPGREEDLEGKPFVGRSGQLLDRMLAAIGLSRRSGDRESSVFITNTIFWRPPGNRTPTEAETVMCLPFLLRAIAIQNPDFIVCVGGTPAQRLTGRSDGILKTRGKWTEIIVSGRRIPLLPTLHPAYLLRQPAHKRLAWRDLLSLRQALDAH